MIYRMNSEILEHAKANDDENIKRNIFDLLGTLMNDVNFSAIKDDPAILDLMQSVKVVIDDTLTDKDIEKIKNANGIKKLTLIPIAVKIMTKLPGETLDAAKNVLKKNRKRNESRIRGYDSQDDLLKLILIAVLKYYNK